MAIMVEIHHTGAEPGERAEIVAVIEHALADRAGDWHVSILGSQSSMEWEMKISGPSGFERTYDLDGAAGEHDPRVIGKIVTRMIPGA